MSKKTDVHHKGWLKKEKKGFFGTKWVNWYLELCGQHLLLFANKGSRDAKDKIDLQEVGKVEILQLRKWDGVEIVILMKPGDTSASKEEPLNKGTNGLGGLHRVPSW